MKKISAVPYYLKSSFAILTSVRPLSAPFRLLRKPRHAEVQIPRLDIAFEVRCFMDVWTMKETFLDRDYVQYGFKPEQDWTVVDVGAALGDFSVQMAKVYNVARVVAVEPAPSAIPLLSQNLAHNGAENVTVIGKALSVGARELWLDTEGVPGSLGTTADKQRSGQVRVEAMTLSELFDEAGIERCSLLKLDCEGAEFALICDSDEDFLARTDRIVMEFHEGIDPGGRGRTDLTAALERHGFVTETFESKVHRDLGFIRATRRDLAAA